MENGESTILDFNMWRKELRGVEACERNYLQVEFLINGKVEESLLVGLPVSAVSEIVTKQATIEEGNIGLNIINHGTFTNIAPIDVELKNGADFEELVKESFETLKAVNKIVKVLEE